MIGVVYDTARALVLRHLAGSTREAQGVSCAAHLAADAGGGLGRRPAWREPAAGLVEIRFAVHAGAVHAGAVHAGAVPVSAVPVSAVPVSAVLVSAALVSALSRTGVRGRRPVASMLTGSPSTVRSATTPPAPS